MRELHVVALSEDGRSILLATSKRAATGGFRVKLDDRIAAALRGDLPRPGESAVRTSSVTPKEIQSRMRAGESAEEIAADAGVPVARVERFAGPVLSERERIIDEARAGFLSRGRLGPSQLPLGDAVDAALAETPSLRPETVGWTARRLDSGHWLVQVSYVSRARTRTGSWVYDPATRSLVPSDPASAALGHTGEQPAAHRPSAAPRAARPAPVARKNKPRVARKPAPAKAAAAPARRAAAKPSAASAAKAARPVAKPAPKKAGTKKAAAARTAAARTAAARTAAARKASAARPTPRPAVPKAAAKRPAAAKAPVKRPSKAPATTAARTASEAVQAPPQTAEVVATIVAEPDSPPTLRVVPAPAAELTPTPTPKRRAAGERATVPDWADVLFGAAPRADRTDG